jgi:hypothetical protein
VSKFGDLVDELGAMLVANLKANNDDPEAADQRRAEHEAHFTPDDSVPFDEDEEDERRMAGRRGELVAVERDVHTAGGATFKRHYWVSPADVKPTDRVVSHKDEPILSRHPYHHQMRTRAKAYLTAGKEVPQELLHKLGVKHVDELKLGAVSKKPPGPGEPKPPEGEGFVKPPYYHQMRSRAKRYVLAGKPVPPALLAKLGVKHVDELGLKGVPKAGEPPIKPAPKEPPPKGPALTPTEAQQFKSPVPVDKAKDLDVKFTPLSKQLGDDDKATLEAAWGKLNEDFKAAPSAPPETASDLRPPSSWSVLSGGGLKRTYAGDYNRQMGQMRLQPNYHRDIAKLVADGGLTTSISQIPAMKVFLHEALHARSSVRASWSSPAGKALEEATTEITANHFLHRMLADGTVKLGDPHHASSAEKMGITVDHGTMMSLAPHALAGAAAHNILEPNRHVSYPGYVAAFSAAVAAIDGHNILQVARTAQGTADFNRAVAVRAMQVKARDGTYYANPADDNRIGTMARMALDRAGIKEDHPKFRDLALDVGKVVYKMFNQKDRRMRQSKAVSPDAWTAELTKVFKRHKAVWPGVPGKVEANA